MKCSEIDERRVVDSIDDAVHAKKRRVLGWIRQYGFTLCSCLPRHIAVFLSALAFLRLYEQHTRPMPAMTCYDHHLTMLTLTPHQHPNPSPAADTLTQAVDSCPSAQYASIPRQLRPQKQQQRSTRPPLR